MGIVLISVSALSLSGCLAEAGEGEVFEEIVGEVEQAIGPECAGAFATASFISTINYTSPQTYNTASCYKGVVVDVQNYASTRPLGYSAHTTITWEDSVPLASDSNHVSNCNNQLIHADLFELGLNGTWVYKTSRADFGFWQDDDEGLDWNTCLSPEVSFSDLMSFNKTYRISATARTYNGSGAPTRTLAITTQYLYIAH